MWAASTTVNPPPTREHTTHPSVRIQARYSGLRSGPRRGCTRFLRTGVRRFGGRHRRNGPFRRNGTRLVSTMTSIWFSIGGTKRPAREGIPSRTLCLERGTRERQDGRIRPPNSPSQCCQKLQCFWLHSSDCRFGQYIPDPMAFCAIGYRTWVARMSGPPTV